MGVLIWGYWSVRCLLCGPCGVSAFRRSIRGEQRISPMGHEGAEAVEAGRRKIICPPPHPAPVDFVFSRLDFIFCQHCGIYDPLMSPNVMCLPAKSYEFEEVAGADTWLGGLIGKSPSRAHGANLHVADPESQKFPRKICTVPSVVHVS